MPFDLSREHTDIYNILPSCWLPRNTRILVNKGSGKDAMSAFMRAYPIFIYHTLNLSYVVSPLSIHIVSFPSKHKWEKVEKKWMHIFNNIYNIVWA